MTKDQDKTLKVVPIKRTVKFDSLEDFLAIDLPPIEMIIDPWLPEKGIAMIHAKKGIGKTFFCLSLAYAIATGKEFLGWKINQPRRVLYIDGEMRSQSMQNRIKIISKMFGTDQINGNFLLITPDRVDEAIDLYDKSFQLGIDSIIFENNVDVVIIDNVSSLVYGYVENDASSWEPVQTWELFLRKRGISVIRVMHSGKGDLVRANSKVEDVVDTTIHLTRPKDYEKKEGARFVLEFEKCREFYGTDSDSFEAQLKQDHEDNLYWHKQDAELSTYQKVIQYSKDGHQQFEIADLLDISKGLVSRYIKKAGKEGKL